MTLHEEDAIVLLVLIQHSLDRMARARLLDPARAAAGSLARPDPALKNPGQGAMTAACPPPPRLPRSTSTRSPPHAVQPSRLSSPRSRSETVCAPRVDRVDPARLAALVSRRR